ncbi:hypothetical protein IMY05_006G0127000 [Salix suchowensis]|nr:hypothetical protein IMY05_006G0127000 [Salix suchowensis]
MRASLNKKPFSIFFSFSHNFSFRVNVRLVLILLFLSQLHPIPTYSFCTLVDTVPSNIYLSISIYIYIISPSSSKSPPALASFDYTLILLATKQISRPDLQSVLETSYFLSVCCLVFN